MGIKWSYLIRIFYGKWEHNSIKHTGGIPSTCRRYAHHTSHIQATKHAPFDALQGDLGHFKRTHGKFTPMPLQAEIAPKIITWLYDCDRINRMIKGYESLKLIA